MQIEEMTLDQLLDARVDAIQSGDIKLYRRINNRISELFKKANKL